MSGITTLKIEPLGKDNYEAWKIQMEAILIKNDAWVYVSGRKRRPAVDGEAQADWDTADMKARSDIILAMSPSELRQVKDCVTSQETWERLKEIHQSKGPARKAMLLKRLILTKMTTSGEVTEHLNSFFEIVDKLKNMGIEINDDLLSIVLLYSLPAEFDNFRCAIESRDELPKPESLKIKIREEFESRKSNFSPGKSDAFIIHEGPSGLSPTESAERVDRFQGRQREQGPNRARFAQFKCFRCGRMGHKASECRARRPIPEEEHRASQSEERTLLSRTAGLVGTTQPPAAAGYTWCLDSGSTSHMCKRVCSEVGPRWVLEPWSLLHISNSTGGQVDCVASGEPKPHVWWELADEKPLPGSPAVLQTLSNGTLRFLPFHPSAYRHDIHAATYRCHAKNSAGAIISRDVKVKAVVLQYLELEVEVAKSYTRGNTAVLRCVVPNFMKEFISITSWLQDSSFNIYPSLKGDGKYQMLPTGELLVRRLDDADVYRSYQCRAVNTLTGQTLLSLHRVRFHLTDSIAPVSPRIASSPAAVHAKKEQTVVLPCFAQGSPPPTYFWKKEGDKLVEVGGRVITANEALILHRAELADTGTWVCVANNSAGEQTKTISLHVGVPLSVSLLPSRQVIVDVGAEAEINCYVTGGKNPVITWFKNAVPLIYSTHSSGEGNKLRIEKVGRDDAGMYQCLVRDEDISMQATLQLVLGASKPQLTYKFIQQTVQPGPAMSLKCIAIGNPTPHITWALDGFPLPMNERYLIGQYVTLNGDVVSHVNISNVHVQDGGIYQCKASNKVGETVHSAEMRVYGAPYIRSLPNISAVAGEALYLPCPVAGYPIDSITWGKDGKKIPFNRNQKVFQNGTLYLGTVGREQDQGTYKCFAQNKQGKASSQNIFLSVIVAPKIAPFVLQKDLHVGDRVGVQCFVTKGDLPLRLSWAKDGGPLPPGVLIRPFGEYTSSLGIDSLREEHAGNYTCLARNNASAAEHTAELLVNVPPKLGPFTFGDLVEGVRTQVQCVVQSGDPPLNITWLKDGIQLKPDIDLHMNKDDFSSTLAIGRVRMEHAGDYTCVAANAAKSTKLSSRLIVSVPPRWVLEPKDVNVTRDGRAVFNCGAEGFPSPQVVWRRVAGPEQSEYQDLSESRNGFRTYPNGTLIIEPTLQTYAGQYLCEATNGIPPGISATVNLNVYNPPEFESASSDERVRRGQSQILVCEAKGDMPMKISWTKQSSIQLNPRFEVREKQVSGGMISELLIENSIKSDSGQYTCIASNPYGTAQKAFLLQVQDAPGKPTDVRVADITSRSLKVTWRVPKDEQTLILHYAVQYKKETGLISDEWESINVGNEQFVTITNLSPASVYSIRVKAENQLGAGEPSDIIQVTTNMEAPSGEPQSLSVATVSSRELKASWLPPPVNTHNGELLGYYLGIREYNGGAPPVFNFTTVNFQPNGNSVRLSGLRPFRKYGVVVQAFNQKGGGPMSKEFIAHTLEDAPSAAPQKVQCRSESSQGVIISWEPPPPRHQNGRIQGYKIYFENMMEYPPGHIEAETKTSTETVIRVQSLQKYANYSVQVWAFTSANDGIKSSPIYCSTDEDIPGAPANIKVLSTGINSLTVSWLHPAKPNGKITGYWVYWRALENGKHKSPEKVRIKPHETFYKIEHLSSSGTYELWVSASTKIGEGESTHVVYATPSNRDGAGIISFGGLISVKGGERVILPCLALGKPPPTRNWTPKSLPHNVIIQSDGSLIINNAQKIHQRNFSCSVENQHGSDEITYHLRVLVPPEPPLLRISGRGSEWLEISWTMKEDGGSAIRGYILEHAPFSSGMLQWNEERLSRELTSFKLQPLVCGKKYNLRMCAYNSAGTGETGTVLTAQTSGGKPLKPTEIDFIQGNVSTVTLNLKSWNNNGCPILSFSIEYKEITLTDWLTVGNAIQTNEKFEIIGLWPGRKYKIKVQAVNSAGATTAEYVFKTPQNLGVTLSPNSVKILSEETPFYFDPGFLLPVASFLTLLSAGAILTLCFRKKRDAANSSRVQSQPKDPQNMVTLDNKTNLAQREQFYAAVQKGMTSPMHHDLQFEQVPEYSDDISPYATFHVATQQVSTNQHHLHNFMYHNHVLTAMETMPMKSGKDEYLKGRAALKGSKCLSAGSDYSGSTTDQWSEPSRPERVTLNVYAGNSIQGESSSSPEPSPIMERRQPFRHKHIVRKDKANPKFSTTLDPPSGFTDSLEGNVIECDKDSIERLKHRSKGFRPKRERRSQFTIAV